MGNAIFFRRMRCVFAVMQNKKKNVLLSKHMTSETVTIKNICAVQLFSYKFNHKMGASLVDTRFVSSLPCYFLDLGKKKLTPYCL